MNFRVPVLLDGQVLLIVQQVDDFAAIDLKEAHVELHVSGRLFKHVLDGFLRGS